MAQTAAQALLQPPHLIERGGPRVQQAARLLAPSHDPGQHMPPGRALLRHPGLVLPPHPERDRQLPLRVPHDPREILDDRRPDGGPDGDTLRHEPEFLRAHPHPVVRRDQQRPRPVVEAGVRRFDGPHRRPARSRTPALPPPAPQEPVARQCHGRDGGQQRHHEIDPGRLLDLLLGHRPRDGALRPAREPIRTCECQGGQHQPHHPDQPAHKGVHHPRGYGRAAPPRTASDRG